MKQAVLALLLSVTPALAWDGPGWGDRWSASLQEVRGGVSYNSVIYFTRRGKDWRVEARCEAYDPSTKAWLFQTGTGIARRSEQGLRATVERLDGFFINQDSVVFGTMLCPSGSYNLGTGD
jgi:hypothetical protein